MSDPSPTEDLADLYENAPCGYVSLTPDGKIAKLNHTLSNWLGRRPDELLSHRFNECLSFGARIAFETHLAPLLRLQGHVGEIALDLLGADGTKVPVIANASEKRSEAGEHLFTRITLFRAVDRRQYERSLVAAREEAETAVLAEHETAILREQFIAVLGHDLRNPLAAIDAGVRLLERESLSDRSRFITNGMAQSVARAALLIDNVLDFARGRLGEGLILERSASDPLAPVLEQVSAEVRAATPDRTILTDFAIEGPVYCDRQRIGQLAANLISNAVTHGAPGTPIEVLASSANGRFELSVTNQGPPIPDAIREQLFQPFVRGDAHRNQQGLGLYGRGHAIHVRYAGCRDLGHFAEDTMRPHRSNSRPN